MGTQSNQFTIKYNDFEDKNINLTKKTIFKFKDKKLNYFKLNYDIFKYKHSKELSSNFYYRKMIHKLIHYQWKSMYSSKDKVPTPRWGHASVVINNEFVIFGGYAGKNTSI